MAQDDGGACVGSHKRLGSFSRSERQIFLVAGAGLRRFRIIRGHRYGPQDAVTLDVRIQAEHGDEKQQHVSGPANNCVHRFFHGGRVSQDRVPAKVMCRTRILISLAQFRAPVHHFLGSDQRREWISVH